MGVFRCEKNDVPRSCDVRLPIKLTNPLNGSHRHWSVRSKERRKVRTAVALSLNPVLVKHDIRMPVRVTLTRIAPSNGLDPHDALGASLKAAIDGVADALGLKNDRDGRVTWVLQQKRGPEYGVQIHVEERR